jgi:hypothetical protein
MTDTIFFGPMIGELGWAASRWHAYCRFLKHNDYQHHKCIIADYDWRYPLYEFADEFIPLPEWFTRLPLHQDCYEAVPLDAPAGGFTTPDVYTSLLQYFKQFYDEDKTKVIRTPRGCNIFLQFRRKQMWKTLEPSDNAVNYINSLVPQGASDIVVVSARGRARAKNRNIPEHIWEEVVDKLSNRFLVIITGTPHSSFLTKKVGSGIINLINRPGKDGLDVLIAALHKAAFSVTSQSGPSHMSLLTGTPSYIMGHEKQRHSVGENWLKTMCLFREVPNQVYAALDAETILSDIIVLYEAILEGRHKVEQATRESMTAAKQHLDMLVDRTRGLKFAEIDTESLRQEIVHARA